MILRADFGWVILVAFVFWVLQVLRAGATGKGGGRPGPTPPPPSKPGGTQREGVELEQLLRHLERRLGEAGERAAQKRTTVTVRRPAPAQHVPVVVRREPVPAPVAERAAEEASLEVDVGDATGASLERHRPLAPAVTPPYQPLRRPAGDPATVTDRRLRDAVLWREILGPPKGLQ